MNRKDREITDFAEIVGIFERCNTLRLGLVNNGRPYVVPVSFGLEAMDKKVIIYFHGAVSGLKADCIAQNDNVCIEADIFYKTEIINNGITARYESVIGVGTVSKAEGEEKIYGLKKLVGHYGFDNYPIDRCKGLDNTAVYKIVLSELTGKRNLPANG